MFDHSKKIESQWLVETQAQGNSGAEQFIIYFDSLTKLYAMPFRDHPHINFEPVNSRSIRVKHKMLPLSDNRWDFCGHVRKFPNKYPY